MRMAKEKGALFHVSRISAGKPAEEKAKIPPQHMLEAIEELLVAVEDLFRSNKSAKGDFRTLLKKKFLELAETYPFLDPFAGELEYTDRKVRFTGEAGEARLAEGLLASVKSLGEENGIRSEIKAAIDTWLSKHGRKLIALGVKP